MDLLTVLRPRFFAFLILLFGPAFSPITLLGQQAAPPPPAASTPAGNTDFLKAADEVLADMSQITGWKLKTPLKKSLRSRDEIRAYVIRQMDDEKDATARYASRRSAEAFGLIPRGFDLDDFLVNLLTEQIAGLYDPKAHEFYIAAWIPAEDQRMVMAHELTHALEDQYFPVEDWVKAAKPNDDAELARESVLEGSAMAAMLEYMLRDKNLSLRDLPDIDPSAFVGDMADTPILKKAPPFIKDSLMFPYFAGLNFSIVVLKGGGWRSFDAVFAKPPANTQQILHPEIYRAGKIPEPLKLDLPDSIPGDSWTLLEQNHLGEFGWREVGKQYFEEQRAKDLAAAWDGDIYSTYESKSGQKEGKSLLLFTRLRLASEAKTNQFFIQYSQALEKKYPTRSHISAAQSYLSFDSPDGPVSFRCVAKECITQEGGDRALFLQWTKHLTWLDPAVSITSIATQR
jgi:hypothetical protein